MIVTPEGLKVFPEDVEAVLNEIPGVRESAVVGRDHVHAVLVLEDIIDPNEVVRRANLQLEDHQKIRSVSMWPGERLPRTEGTQKLKHGEIQTWVESGTSAPTTSSGQEMIDLLRRYAPDRAITPNTTLDELGLSSLDRVELMIDLEQHLDTSIDEALLTGAQTVSALAEIGMPPSAVGIPHMEPRLPGESHSQCRVVNSLAPTHSAFRARPCFRPRTLGFAAGACNLCPKPSEPSGYALDFVCFACALPLPRCSGNVEGVFRCSLFARAPHMVRTIRG